MEHEAIQVSLGAAAGAWVQERAQAEGLSASEWLARMVERAMEAECYQAAYARFREFDGVGMGSARSRMSREETHERG